MRKIIPIINVILLYMFVIPYIVYIDVYEQFFNKIIGPGYFMAVIISGVFNVAWAFYLYKKEDDKNLKFAMCLCIFGLIPFYFFFELFWLIIIGIGSGINNGPEAMGLAMICNTFLVITNAFYGFNLARRKEYPFLHKVCHFIFIINVIATIVLLIDRRNRNLKEKKS